MATGGHGLAAGENARAFLMGARRRQVHGADVRATGHEIRPVITLRSAHERHFHISPIVEI